MSNQPEPTPREWKDDDVVGILREDVAKDSDILFRELLPEVQAALSGGRDDRWERMWKEFKNTMVAFKSHGTVTYEAVLETMNEMESMSAKEGE